MAVYGLRRRPLLSALFIFVMIQGITSLPHGFYTATDSLGSGYDETPFGDPIWSTDENSHNQKRPLHNGRRPGIDRHELSTTSRSELDWDLRGFQGKKVVNAENPPAVNRGTFSAPVSDSRIVFPTDDRYHTLEKIARIKVPVCEGKTFCENTATYPEALLNNAMNEVSQFKYLSGIDVITNLVQRIDISEDTPLCASNEQIVYPQSAENKNREWLFVVNHRNFTQGVRVESCSKIEGECNLVEGFAEGYRTICKQNYIYRQLAAISSTGSIKPDMFRFPSSCCCHVKFLGNPLLRMGISLPKENVTTVPQKDKKTK